MLFQETGGCRCVQKSTLSTYPLLSLPTHPNTCLFALATTISTTIPTTPRTPHRTTPTHRTTQITHLQTDLPTAFFDKVLIFLFCNIIVSLAPFGLIYPSYFIWCPGNEREECYRDIILILLSDSEQVCHDHKWVWYIPIAWYV